MKIKKIITCEAQNSYWSEQEEIIGDCNPMTAVNVYPERSYQLVNGFGGAFTEASAYNLSLLSEEKKKEVLESYFSEKGTAYNLCRTHINSCDFGLGNYAYLEEETDEKLSGFSVERDERYLIPMIKMAKEIASDEMVLLASPWSPPAFMKSNGEMNNGGFLIKKYYKMWADYIVCYLEEYKKRGIEVSMITVQNEPQAVQTWDSCIYSSEDEKVMVRDYLGPALEKAGFSHVKIIIWDHNKEIVYERAMEILSDEQAKKYISGVGFHWYSGDHFESVGLVKEVFPDQELYFTEGCVEYSRFADSNEVAKAEMYAHDMIGNFNAGMNGYMDWNLLLDEKGGPNHVNNYCAAPIMCNPKEDTVEKRLSYYYIGHFSKFVKRGAKRIAVSKYTDKLDVTAFLNPDGERVVVIMNKSDASMPVTIREWECGGQIVVESHSIQTICYRKEA